MPINNLILALTCVFTLVLILFLYHVFKARRHGYAVAKALFDIRFDEELSQLNIGQIKCITGLNSSYNHTNKIVKAVIIAEGELG
ncbi:MAG: hypothetical protein AB8G22_07615, partial [Saprospiraceae bacterium]